MRAYMVKGWKDKKPVAYCIHQKLFGLPKQWVINQIEMNPWETTDKHGKIEKGVMCPKCYRSEHITI